MLRAVILDFDGVITDSEILHLRAFNTALRGYRINISKEEYYRDYLGLTDRDLLGVLVKRGLLKADQVKIDELAEQKKENFDELFRSEGSIIDGVGGFLQLLKTNQVPAAICSGALLGEIEGKLNRTGLNHYFEVIVAAEHVKRGKPHPDSFQLTLKKLNHGRTKLIEAGECIVIEDSHWGLQGAKSAGMHTIAVTNSYDAEQLSMADKIVNNLKELNMGELERLCE